MSDAVIVAIIMAVPTLLVYFGSRQKTKAETQSIVEDNWKKLTDAQSEFSDNMETRLQTLNARINEQDKVIADQNKTIAEQNATIAAQSARIAEQDKVILEQNEIIADLVKQIEGMGATPVHKRGRGNGHLPHSSPGGNLIEDTNAVLGLELLCYT
jgi:uncharacterized coiled-coil protein SlyX